MIVRDVPWEDIKDILLWNVSHDHEDCPDQHDNNHKLL